MVILQLTVNEAMGLAEALELIALSEGELTEDETSVYAKTTAALEDLETE